MKETESGERLAGEAFTSRVCGRLRGWWPMRKSSDTSWGYISCKRSKTAKLWRNFNWHEKILEKFFKQLKIFSRTLTIRRKSFHIQVANDFSDLQGLRKNVFVYPKVVWDHEKLPWKLREILPKTQHATCQRPRTDKMRIFKWDFQVLPYNKMMKQRWRFLCKEKFFALEAIKDLFTFFPPKKWENVTSLVERFKWGEST